MTDTFLPEITVEHPGLYEDEWFDLRGNGDSYLLARWFPADEQGTPTQPKAVIVFVHGFAEHMGRYRNIFKLFVDRGYEINGFDQRGFGRTSYESENRSKMHGRTTWADQLSDVERMIRLARKRADARWGKDKVPLFLMGHSMGGGISLAFFTCEAGSGPSEETMAGVRRDALFALARHPLSDPDDLCCAGVGVCAFVAPRTQGAAWPADQ